MSKNEEFDLGVWLGRREAFAVVAGKCSAADVASLTTIRKQKLYRAKNMTWEQFCERHLSMSRRTAEMLIRQFEEFGPTYFELAQLTRITAEEYRRIAGSMSEDGIAFRGEKIRLLPENSERIAEAVRELSRDREPAVRKEEAPQPLDKVQGRIEAVLNELQLLCERGLSQEEMSRLRDLVVNVRARLLGVQLGLPH